MLHTTMTEKNLTLFCIVEGESVSHAFKLKNIPSSDDVDDLKDFIKAKQSPDFNDIAASKLTLWRVSIPKVKQSSAIMIDALEDKTELDEPRTSLSRVFSKPLDDSTYILTQISKQATLDSAVDDTIENVKNSLRKGVRTIIGRDITGEASRLLSRMVLAYHLQDAKISFSSQQQSDFVDKALCRLQQHPDGVHLIMDEPIVVDAVEEELKASGKNPAFTEYLDELYQIVTNFGLASTSKGDALEPLLQIDGINTANGFGYTASGIASDLVFLTERPPNKMLIAKFGTRPDGAWFFSDKRYAGSFAIKFFSSNISQEFHKGNETSSDIRACFLKADGEVNKSLARIRRAYEDTCIPSSLRGILRIHLELPDVKNGMPATHVRTNPVTGVEDVMVYINLSNMDDFFFEGIAEHRGDLVNLKKIIRFVCQK
ncbi:MAG: hypothetical protein J3R72DRAFT_508522 [Linnemannia gamsii]|nr:MAG: hypothetical protein J3R72DRAFT_508522 [Linnemannia gamsii]